MIAIYRWQFETGAQESVQDTSEVSESYLVFIIHSFIIESCTKHKQNISLHTVQRSAPTNRTVHQKIDVHRKKRTIK